MLAYGVTGRWQNDKGCEAQLSCVDHILRRRFFGTQDQTDSTPSGKFDLASRFQDADKLLRAVAFVHKDNINLPICHKRRSMLNITDGMGMGYATVFK